MESPERFYRKKVALPTEILEEHRNEHTCIYEMVLISNDDGAATTIFIPDTEGIDTDLLAMCRSFATPAVTSS